MPQASSIRAELAGQWVSSILASYNDARMRSNAWSCPVTLSAYRPTASSAWCTAVWTPLPAPNRSTAAWRMTAAAMAKSG